MDIKIMVAAHKPYWMPQDDVYMPIHVGCEGKESIGFTGDNTGLGRTCRRITSALSIIAVTSPIKKRAR